MKRLTAVIKLCETATLDGRGGKAYLKSDLTFCVDKFMLKLNLQSLGAVIIGMQDR